VPAANRVNNRANRDRASGDWASARSTSSVWQTDEGRCLVLVPLSGR
jgi:hypothetical protein